MSVRVIGSDQLRHMAAVLYYQDARMPGELRKHINNAVAPLAPEIRAEALRVLPHRGGYAPILARAVKVSTRIASREGSVALVIYARGKAEDRDLVALDRGILRHPLWGRRKHWYTTSVRPGLVSRPVGKLSDRLTRDVAAAVDELATKLATG